MSASVTSALLDQLRATFGVHIIVGRATDADGVEARTAIAVGRNGERWITKAEDEYAAACRLAELMGFEVEDG